MGTPAFLLFCLCFGVLAAFAWLVWRYRGMPSLGAMRTDFERQQSESTPQGRVLYPIYVAGLLGAGAAFVGLMERSAWDAAGWALALGPLLLMYFLPRRSL
jgi:hypothetical protein